MIREVYFYERQYFSFFLFLIAIGLGIGGMFLGLPETGTMAPATFQQGIIGVVLIVGAAVVINFLAMTIWVYPDEIKIQFGLFLPYYTRRIKISSVVEWQCTEYSPIRESGGWGIRTGTHNDERTTYLTARGDKAIWLKVNELHVLIGTQFSEKMNEAIDKAVSTSN